MRRETSLDFLRSLSRVVFVMLNPSTADAFKPDRTVSKCVAFAQRWGADVLDVVNLFALRSTNPEALYDGARVAAGECGDYSHLWRLNVGNDHVNDDQIIETCAGARVIVAWGNHGELSNRGDEVRDLLTTRGILLEHLGLTGAGYPLHPLARGKSFIPLDREPVAWQ